MKAKLYFDGGARPKNPGHAGIGLIIKINGEKHPLSRYIGIKTNNQAEYTGLIVGIKYARELGAREIEIISDSQLVVKQVLGEYKCKEERLKPLREESVKLLNKLFPDSWSIEWKKRSDNAESDKLCTEAIFWGMAQNPFFSNKVKKTWKVEGKVIDPFGSSPPPTPSRKKIKSK